MQPLDLLLIALATFYLAHAVSSTYGPWHVFEWLRDHLPLGGLTQCLVCLSPWSAGLFYGLLLTPAAPLVWILAAAGLSVLAWRYTGGDHV
jgi:hypothetical protein